MRKAQKVVTRGRIGSGYRRSISAWTAFLFGLHCISLSSSGLIPFSWVASVWPGASIPWVLTIALIFCAVHGLAFASIGIAAPEEAADYALVSQTISHRLAFAMSWTLVLFSGIVAGGLAAWVPKTALPSLLVPLSLILGDGRYTELSTLIARPLGTIIFGGLIILIAATTTAQKNFSLLRGMLNAGLIFGIVAWAVIFYSLLSAQSPIAFHDAWNHFMSHTGANSCFDCRIPLAIKSGMQINHSFWSTTMAGLIMGFWIYYGYYIPTFFSEEVELPVSKTLIAASAGSLVLAYLIFMGAALMLNRLVPNEWIAAEGYLFNNPALVAKATGGRDVIAMPWITFYAAILKPKLILILIVAFGWIFTLINLIQTYLFYAGRILWKWSLDRVAPDWVIGKSLGKPNPNRAILLITILALVGLLDAAYGGPLGPQLTFAFFAVVTQILPISALTLLPKLNADAFSMLPKSLRRTYLGVPLISIVGAVTLAYLLWMVIASFLYPAAGVGNPVKTLLLLIGFIVSGLLFYEARRRYRLRTTHTDLLDTYRVSPGHPDQNEPDFD
jgi:amino acid transporter